MEGRARPASKKDLARLALAWAFVAAPLLWGVTETLRRAWALFR